MEWEKLKVIKKFEQNGHCKSVKLLENNVVKKVYDEKKTFKRELSALQKLQDLEYVPRLLYFDDKKMNIYMSYCGKTLSQHQFIKNAKKIDRMAKELKLRGIFHNDLKPRNVCKIGDSFYLIDFSWADSKPYKSNNNDSEKPGFNKVKHYLKAIGRR